MRSAGTRLGYGIVALALALNASACEKPSHANIDKWRTTTQGPGKLAKALRDGGLDADLRAHAAQALISIDKGDEVVPTLEKLPDGERGAVLERLVPRLWSDCKLEDELAQPTSKQLRAKDALFEVRATAPPKVQEEIDGYLVDWLTGFYEGRALVGKYSGKTILRHIGPKAGPKMIAVVKGLLAESKGDKIVEVKDEVLRGLAFTGSPEAIEYLLRLGDKPPEFDKDLEEPQRVGVRAMGSLYEVFVTDKEMPRPSPKLLQPHVGLLQAIAASDEQTGANVNVAYELIVAVGKPECLEPLRTMTANNKREVGPWQAAQKGLACAGADAIVPITEAMPTEADYEEGILDKYWTDKIAAYGPAAATAARQLLKSQSWVARLTAVRVLERVGSKEDAAALRQMASDATKARGWWGKDEEKKKKPEPTLGMLAGTAANKLEQK